MEAIILVGGFGTRLRSLVSDVPKPMALVNKRPFIEYVLDHWIPFGIDHFIFAAGYKHEQILNHFGKSYKGIAIDYSIEPDPLGTGGGLYLAFEKIVEEKPFFVINGDSFFSINPREVTRFHTAKGSSVTLVLRRMETAVRYGNVHLDTSGKILQFASPVSGNPPYMINGGVYFFEYNYLKEKTRKWEKRSRLSLEMDLFPSWLLEGDLIYGKEETGFFIDIGVPEDFVKSQIIFQSM